MVVEPIKRKEILKKIWFRLDQITATVFIMMAMLTWLWGYQIIALFMLMVAGFYEIRASFLLMPEDKQRKWIEEPVRPWEGKGESIFNRIL